jgi:hypothetical protein
VPTHTQTGPFAAWSISDVSRSRPCRPPTTGLSTHLHNSAMTVARGNVRFNLRKSNSITLLQGLKAPVGYFLPLLKPRRTTPFLDNFRIADQPLTILLS